MRPNTFHSTVLSAKVIVIATCALVQAPVTAEMLPFFILEHSVWKATDIVLATEGDAIDGRLSVVETWRGGLKPGDAVNLPQLADFASEESRRLYRWPLPAGTPNADATVSGDRMILFLVRPREDGPGAAILPDSLPWKPAGYFPDNDFKISIAWVDNADAYALVQEMNPGPLVMRKTRNALEIKALVAASDVIAAGLADAIRAKNPTLAVQAAIAYDAHGFHDGRSEAFSALEAMGETAVPALRALLESGALTHQHPAIIKAMAVAGGAKVAPDFIQLLEKQLVFWQKQAPKLERGWWNNEPDDVRNFTREQYSCLLTALQQLAPMNYAPARDVTVRLRNFWIAADSLQDTGDGQMLDAIDAVLAGLDATGVKSGPTS